MPLNKAQLMAVPGGPGITGAVRAGNGIAIATDGTISIDPNTVIARLVAGQNVVLSPTTGVGTVTINAIPDQGGDFPRGTITLFVQAAAPNGWTQVTSQNNKAIRVVNGAGGGTGGTQPFTSTFTSVPVTGSVSFSGLSVSGGSTNTVNQTPTGSVSVSGLSVGSTTIGVGEMPNHTHNYIDNPNQRNSGSGNANRPADENQNQTTSGTGGNGAHSHSASGSGSFNGNNMSHSHSVNASVSGNGSFSGNPINLNLQYVDAILCSRN
jgi:hypothetical protein